MPFFEAYGVGHSACVVTSSCKANDLAKLSKVKAKLEIIGDYEDMEKVRDVLKELAKKP
jgi:hypothetical protein